MVLTGWRRPSGGWPGAPQPGRPSCSSAAAGGSGRRPGRSPWAAPGPGLPPAAVPGGGAGSGAGAGPWRCRRPSQGRRATRPQAWGLCRPCLTSPHLTAHSGVFFFLFFFSFSLLWDVLPLKRSMLRFYCVSGIPVRKADPTTTGRLHWEGALPPGSHYFHSKDEL